jgi:2-octaprenylphenol hydroxylase
MSGADFEIVIAGGGPVGATLAALLARHGGVAPARIALLAPDLERSLIPLASDAPCDLRVVALARAAQNVLRAAGAWQRMPAARICAYERMRIWHESLPVDGAATLVFDAAEIAEPELGVIVEQRAITTAALRSFRDAGGTLLHGSLQGIDMQADAAQVHSDAGRHTARLLVGADGVRSLVREQLRIPLQRHAYGQTAIVATLASARPHQHTAWQRFLATGPVALLPLYDGHSSLVWSAADAQVKELMAMPAAEFARRLTAATDAVLGELSQVGERASFPLLRATTTRLAVPRGALVGDAAHQVHPLAGQGINLGFLDTAALCEAVAEAMATREDCGSLRCLRRYEQQRLTDDTLVSWSMSGFNALFSQGGAAGWFGSRALAVAAGSALLRKQLARRAMGLTGEVPALAR